MANAYSVAASLGFPHLLGEGKLAADGETWLLRFTKGPDGKPPALFLGYDQKRRRWVKEVQQ